MSRSSDQRRPRRKHGIGLQWGDQNLGGGVGIGGVHPNVLARSRVEFNLRSVSESAINVEVAKGMSGGIQRLATLDLVGKQVVKVGR